MRQLLAYLDAPPNTGQGEDEEELTTAATEKGEDEAGNLGSGVAGALGEDEEGMATGTRFGRQRVQCFYVKITITAPLLCLPTYDTVQHWHLQCAGF